MKQFVLLSILLLSVISHNAFSQALVEKTNTSGFTMPADVRTEICAIYPSYVKITNRYGGYTDMRFETTQILWVNVSEGIEGVLAAASSANLSESDNFICDAPATTIKARNSQGQDFVLFASGGCGSVRQSRDGGAARMLLDLINRYCPVTHDIGNHGLEMRE